MVSKAFIESVNISSVLKVPHTSSALILQVLIDILINGKKTVLFMTNLAISLEKES